MYRFESLSRHIRASFETVELLKLYPALENGNRQQSREILIMVNPERHDVSFCHMKGIKSLIESL